MRSSSPLKYGLSLRVVAMPCNNNNTCWQGAEGGRSPLINQKPSKGGGGVLTESCTAAANPPSLHRQLSTSIPTTTTTTTTTTSEQQHKRQQQQQQQQPTPSSARTAPQPRCAHSALPRWAWAPASGVQGPRHPGVVERRGWPGPGPGARGSHGGGQSWPDARTPSPPGARGTPL
jgi:hypothetical protein